MQIIINRILFHLRIMHADDDRLCKTNYRIAHFPAPQLNIDFAAHRRELLYFFDKKNVEFDVLNSNHGSTVVGFHFLLFK